MNNFLAEIQAIKPDTGAIVIVRMCARQATSAGIYLDGFEWTNCVTEGNETTLSWWGSKQPQPLTVSYGQINFEVSEDMDNLDWASLDFDGSLATVWVGEDGADFADYQETFTGSVGPFIRDTDTTGHIALLGPEAALARDILTEYSGTGDIEGPADTLGKLKPYVAGLALNVTPILIDPIRFIYQVHGYGPCPVNTIYANALPFGQSVTNYTSYAALKDAKLPNGSWATCEALGLFRIANDVGGAAITADVGTPQTVGSIVVQLLKLAGLSNSRIGSSCYTAGRFTNFYLTDQAQVIDIAGKVAFEGSRYLIADSRGRFELGRYQSDATPGMLRSDGRSDPFVLPDSITQEAKGAPPWRLSVGYERSWTVLTGSQISPLIATLGADLVALNAKAQGALDAAEQASVDAALALKRIEEIGGDGVLTRTEKMTLEREIEEITSEKRGLTATAQGFGLATAVYTTAYDALLAYIDTLNLSDTDNNTAVDPETFKGKFAAYYVARQNLENAIFNETAKRANWKNVDERPTNLNELDPESGGKLDGIDDNATNSGDPNSPFGNGTVGDAQAAIDAAKAAADLVRKTLPGRVDALIMEPIEKISALQLKASSANLKATKALSDKNALAVTTLETKMDESGRITSEQITQLTSRVKEGEDTVEAGFLEVNRTIADSEKALAENIILTIAKYGESASASMVEERRVRSSKDEALAEDIEQMAVDLTTEFGDKLTGQINDVKQIIADADGIIGTRIEELGVKLVEDVEGEKLAREAAIKVVEQTIIDTDGVTAGRVDTISSRFEDLSKYTGEVADSVNGVNGRVDVVEGVIQVNQETSAKENEARAEETRILKAALDTMNYAALEQDFKTYATKLDGIGAEYTLKVQTMQDGTPAVAGMGIAIEKGISAVNFLADSFRISVPGVTAPVQVFQADAQGVYMPNVRADNIKAGAIDFEFVNRQSLLNPDGGYQMLPGGLIIMWGRYRAFIRSESVFTVSFPMPFPNVCLSFQATPYLNVFNNERDLWVQIIGQPSTTGANVATQAARSNDQNLDGFDWIAFGR
ncbi:gp53-like domain-containing protein [Sphingomonas sp. CFBP 13706]|uniref:gp53-like domain-containing protein n=1 Tax=Sphingomonas sp. CFBP 13706 TaxID=2775314 RepID=UPI001785C806|nr:DUF1983 domain-containing protein [Sphingomonas sp. CFBP 13706]